MKNELVFVLILMVSLFAGCKPTEGELAEIEKTIESVLQNTSILKDAEVHLTKLIGCKKIQFQFRWNSQFFWSSRFLRGEWHD